MDNIEKMSHEQFKELLSKINVSANENQLDQFDEYFRILVEWNSFMNLTGITEYNEVLLKHFADSLALQKAVDEFNNNVDNDKEKISISGKKIMDIGTGAGFPGIPLKIIYTDTEVVLLDSLNKRIKFLNEVIDKLNLNKIEAVHGRAEEFARKPEIREQSDVVVSRAVANLSTLSEYCLPFVKVNGYFIAYKSGIIVEELENSKKAVDILGGKIMYVSKFMLPDSDIERSFVFIKKIRKTSGKYPRKAGMPSKEPLS